MELSGFTETNVGAGERYSQIGFYPKSWAGRVDFKEKCHLNILVCVHACDYACVHICTRNILFLIKNWSISAHIKICRNVKSQNACEARHCLLQKREQRGPRKPEKAAVPSLYTEWECYTHPRPPLPQFIYWNLISNVMVFEGKALGRWWDHGRGAFPNETPESSFPLSPDPVCPVRT